jgi:DNA-binding response OmpR family regulator
MGAVSVLAVSPADEDHVLLEHVFSHSNWKFDRVHTCQKALEFLKRAEISVVICTAQLPDGTWKDLLGELKHQPAPPRLIVASRLADDSLWGEVLDYGGYDVLGKPFDPGEVIRVVSLAWRQWKYESQHLAVPDSETIDPLRTG